ncbi:MAG: phosphate/phosphite/phosphonate ABC transporter substrate-binding protein [Anaerolineae bacterium]|nr:phosphate/phosphite/phosphonate ABC transporter substrate-binding protein [Anaerolineae bacterium]
MINRKAFPRLVLILVIALAACRRAEVEQGPIAAATATATPRSTPLPPVPTAIPPGTDDNPIRMLINPARTVTDAQTTRFEEALQAESDLVVDVSVVDRYAEALAALCDSSPTNVVVAWLDGVTYEAATAQNCGEPVMQVLHGRGSSASSGDVGQIVVIRQGFSQVSSLAGRTFCRLGVDDYYGWLVPSLIMRVNGVDPVQDLKAVVDYDSRNALIEALIDGDCDAIGMSESAFEDLRDSQKEELKSIVSTPALPFAILVYPLSLPLGERIRLDNALQGLAADSEGRSVMQALLEQDSLVRVSRDDFEELTNFLSRTRLDFAQLGN